MSQNISFQDKRKKGEEVELTKIGIVSSFYNYKVRLDEVPLRYINKIYVLTDNEELTDVTLSEQLSGNPTSGSFVVDYETGLVKFNAFDGLNKVKITYYGTGSVWLAEDAIQAKSSSTIFLTKAEMDASTGTTGQICICYELPDQTWKWSTILNKWIPAY